MKTTLALCFLLTLTGCGMSDDDELRELRATDRVERLVRDTAGALTPRPQLELIPVSVTPTACLDKSQSLQKIVVSRAYWLRGVGRNQHMVVSRQVADYWKDQGFQVIAKNAQPDNPDLSGVTEPDKFILALTWGSGDHIYLAATSPCVWPESYR
ncbi:hypothetical protein [Herbidospora daliensis]|uniref:hypothetical protein n=1 Tax=Herbidospora daliensis TaxID=295585 RepID=UPI000781F334|nr:hypothetical protein [Herbidospora daliensis]